MAWGRDEHEIRPKRTYDLEALEELIASLLDASYQGAAIIVEGRRDLQALRALGLPGPVIMASRRSALDLAEDAARNYARSYSSPTGIAKAMRCARRSSATCAPWARDRTERSEVASKSWSRKR